jgi:predicted GIY-YIG superfamily endonuclease
MSGRSIRIFLVDGTANGIMTTEIMNWIGKVIVAPRSQLASLAQRSEAKRTGVYVLTGDDPNSPLKESVYIGESDNVLSRLTQHNSDPSKDFWNRTIVVISKDENLTKAHVRYLESRLIQITAKAGRATLINGTSPVIPSLPEPDIADMEFFLEQLLTLLPVLNFSFASPVPVIPVAPSPDLNQSMAATQQLSSPTFVLAGKDYNAEAQELNGQFVVLKGSRARKKEKESIGEMYADMRAQFIKDKKLIENPDGTLEFTVDIPFTSPSGAARLISGISINGRESWRIKSTGQTYNQWDQNRIAQAEITGSGDT